MIIIPEYLAIHEPKEELLEIINNKTFNDRVLYEKQSDFHDIKVIENEIGRFLHYKDTYQAGFINTQFYKGNLPYINYFTIPYLINPDIKNILLIGFGTGKIVNDWEKLFDNLESIDVVDIEENIFDIAADYFEFKKSDSIHFFLQDGLVFLRENNKKYDLIVTDVASDDGIDDRFLSDDYFKLIKKSLTPNGVFVSNLCSSADLTCKENTFFHSILDTYHSHFKQVSIFKGNESDRVYYKAFFDIDERVIDITNVILISSKQQFSVGKDYEKIKATGLDIVPYVNDLQSF
ncbi:MAG TPA: fused MFS/spermidine synthase [Candidatus Limenecus avicola]|uniref:Fused MFS/spermidine synthase n=1 Tax=Candidatus Limenecus avicola TaxID=2840847 RepID=A0A9D1SRH4_9CLOT|nr:fused MFS/spermidine synthase [Candidatus Limenecus avicola]